MGSPPASLPPFFLSPASSLFPCPALPVPPASFLPLFSPLRHRIAQLVSPASQISQSQLLQVKRKKKKQRKKRDTENRFSKKSIPFPSHLIPASSQFSIIHLVSSRNSSFSHRHSFHEDLIGLEQSRAEQSGGREQPWSDGTTGRRQVRASAEGSQPHLLSSYGWFSVRPRQHPQRHQRYRRIPFPHPWSSWRHSVYP